MIKLFSRFPFNQKQLCHITELQLSLFICTGSFLSSYFTVRTLLTLAVEIIVRVRICTSHTDFILRDLDLCFPTGVAFSARSLNPRMSANRLLLHPREFVFTSTYFATAHSELPTKAVTFRMLLTYSTVCKQFLASLHFYPGWVPEPASTLPFWYYQFSFVLGLLLVASPSSDKHFVLTHLYPASVSSGIHLTAVFLVPTLR